MIASKIRKAGNSFVVTIPPDEMTARGLKEGQLVGFDPVPVELRPVAPPRQSAEEEADTSGDIPHAQVVRDLEEQTERALAGGLYTRAELEQAEREISQGAPWVRSL